MLTERERRLLAQIEASFHREEPALAQLLSRGTRWSLLRHPEPTTVRGLFFTAATMLIGVGLVAAGMTGFNPSLVALGLTIGIVCPLPVWLISTDTRRWTTNGPGLAA